MHFLYTLPTITSHPDDSPQPHVADIAVGVPPHRTVTHLHPPRALMSEVTTFPPYITPLDRIRHTEPPTRVSPCHHRRNSVVTSTILTSTHMIDASSHAIPVDSTLMMSN